MVLFFKSSNPDYIIYMGRDKFENEDLIKWGLPIDVWFHVEDLSSAHVYLRLPEGETIESIPKDVLLECVQLVKHNSRDGCKKDKVNVVYTPWENLKKTSSMEVGEVGYKNESNVKTVYGIEKDKETLKRLNKTMEEKQVEFEKERESYFLEVTNKKKKFYDEKKKKEQEDAKKYKEMMKDKTYSFMDEIGEMTTNKVRKIIKVKNSFYF